LVTDSTACASGAKLLSTFDQHSYTRPQRKYFVLYANPRVLRGARALGVFFKGSPKYKDLPFSLWSTIIFRYEVLSFFVMKYYHFSLWSTSYHLENFAERLNLLIRQRCPDTNISDNLMNLMLQFLMDNVKLHFLRMMWCCNFNGWCGIAIFMDDVTLHFLWTMRRCTFFQMIPG